MTVGSLFAGIGGFDLGLERAGFTIRWQVEIDLYCQRVLAKHWPRVKRYGDIKTIDWGTVEPVDLLCGGFPCQPFSLAGKRRGTEDDRYLWPEVMRCLEVLRPTWFLGENVPGIVKVALDQVCVDLGRINYTVQTLAIPACAIGAPHKRERVWILAYSDREGPQGLRTERKLRETCQEVKISGDDWWASEPSVGRVAYGVPRRMDRLRGLGNAVVPQLVEQIGRMMMEAA